MAYQKGRTFERDLIPWLSVLFPKVRRSGKGFPGADYIRTGPFSIEAKNRKKMELGPWMKQATLDKENEAKRYAVVIHKRRGFGTYGAYVTMTLEDWVQMLADAKGIEVPEDLSPVSDEDDDMPDW